MRRRQSKRWLRVRMTGATVLLLLLGCEAAWGQSSRSQPAAQSSPGDLTQVSIENLMNMEVTSVSKTEQKLPPCSSNFQYSPVLDRPVRIEIGRAHV